MSAKILQLVNSAFFGLPRHVTSPVKAVQFLGLDTVKALVLAVKVFSMFSRADLEEYSVDELWRHSLGAGLCARAIARGEGWGQEETDEGFMAGLLHDIGKLILVEKFPGQCHELVKENAFKYQSYIKPNGIYSVRLMRRSGPTCWAYGAYPSRSSRRWHITIVQAYVRIPGPKLFPPFTWPIFSNVKSFASLRRDRARIGCRIP